MFNYGITCKPYTVPGIEPTCINIIILDNKTRDIGSLPHNVIHMIPTINNNLRHTISKAKRDIDKHNKSGAWDYLKTLSNPYELIFSGSKKFIGRDIKYVKNNICDYNPLSRSFFKMIELCNTFLKSRLLAHTHGIKTLHLAEGPGGFIEGVIHMRKKMVSKHIQQQDLYYGMTLIDNTNNIDIPSWKKSKRFILDNPGVIITAGHDGTGNLYHKCNIEYLMHRFGGKMDLVTADGGFDFSVDYNCQEYLAGRLIFAEIMGALVCLKNGGTFICKFFDIINTLTVDFLYLLQCKFKYIYIFKPKTSRHANSEKYIVCIDYLGSGKEEIIMLLEVLNKFQDIDTQNNLFMAQKSNKFIIMASIFKLIPPNFTKFIANISNLIIHEQIKNINATTRLINKYMHDDLDNEVINGIIGNQRINAYHWCRDNNMRVTAGIYLG